MMFKRSELRSALLVVLFISFAFVSKAQLWITGDDSYNIIEDYDGAVFDVKSNDINLTLESDIYIFISIFIFIFIHTRNSNPLKLNTGGSYFIIYSRW